MSLRAWHAVVGGKLGVDLATAMNGQACDDMFALFCNRSDMLVYKDFAAYVALVTVDGERERVVMALKFFEPDVSSFEFRHVLLFVLCAVRCARRLGAALPGLPARKRSKPLSLHIADEDRDAIAEQLLEVFLDRVGDEEAMLGVDDVAEMLLSCEAAEPFKALFQSINAAMPDDGRNALHEIPLSRKTLQVLHSARADPDTALPLSRDEARAVLKMIGKPGMRFETAIGYNSTRPGARMAVAAFYDANDEIICAVERRPASGAPTQTRKATQQSSESSDERVSSSPSPSYSPSSS